jgi:hypothetical protein
MEIETIRLELLSRSSTQLVDLQGFMNYKGLTKRKSNELLNLLLQTFKPIQDSEAQQNLNITGGSYRNCKAELINVVLEWRALHATDWLAPAMRQLIKAHIQMQWGAAKDAFDSAQKVQTAYELKGHYAIARIALELKSALVQRVFPDDTTNALTVVLDEIDQLAVKADAMKACAIVYAHIGRLTDNSMLLRTKESHQEWRRLSGEMTKLNKKYPDLPFAAWAYKIQGEALLALFKGNVKLAFNCFHQLWNRMNTDANLIDPSDHRFYMFFQSYIELALEAQEWQHALNANELYGLTIKQHFASNKLLMALHETFQVLAQIGRDNSDKDARIQFESLLLKLKQRSSNGQADFNIDNWNLHISANVLLIVVRTAYNYGLYVEAGKILGLVKRFNAKNASSATDLQAIAPLIELVLILEASKTMGEVTFESKCTSCYDFFRKKSQRFPIEMELARLMHGLAFSTKSKKVLFTKTSERLSQLSKTCPYYNAFMLLFNFEGWVNARSKIS